MTRTIVAVVLAVAGAPAVAFGQDGASGGATFVASGVAGLPLVGARLGVHFDRVEAFVDGTRWYRGWGACPGTIPSKCEGDATVINAGLRAVSGVFFVEAGAARYRFSGTRGLTHPSAPPQYAVQPRTYTAIAGGAGLRAVAARHVVADLGVRVVRPFGDAEYRDVFGRGNHLIGLAVGVGYRLPL